MNPSNRSKWSRAPLSALGILISGQSPPSRLVNKEGQGIPYVSGPEQWTGEQVVIDKWTTSTAKIAPERSIFIVMKGAGVGTAFPGREAAIGRDIAAFVPYEPLDREFMTILLHERCKDLVDDARGHIPGLSRPMLLDLWLDVPPLAEQGRIAAKIHEAEDILLRTKEQVGITRTNTRELRDSTFNDAFSGRASEAWRLSHGNEKLAGQTKSILSNAGPVVNGRYAIALGIPSEPVPPGWVWSRLVEIAELRTGHTPSRREPAYWGGDIPWIGIVDARENYGNVINDTEQHITVAGLENSSAEILPVGTICLSRTASIGYVVVTGRPMATSQDFLNWTCGTKLDRDWLLWLFIAERDSFPKFGYGSTHKTIYMDEAERLHVLLPPLAEQQEVVRLINTAITSIEVIAKDVDIAEQAAITARSDTIAAALLGELGTGDAADEDADVLLSNLQENIEVTRAEAGADTAEDQDAVSVDRLVDTVRATATGLHPEKLFAVAGYRSDAVDVFYSHMKTAVVTGAIRYDSAADLVVTNET